MVTIKDLSSDKRVNKLCFIAFGGHHCGRFRYNKYYKRYSARVKVRQIKGADFKKWKYQAMSKRDDCTDGIITPEEFTKWMENSFPNRKPKS